MSIYADAASVIASLADFGTAPDRGRKLASPVVRARRPGGAVTRSRRCTLRGSRARAAAMTMRKLGALDGERVAREKLRAIADEQAALRRVAALAARGAPPSAVFAAVAEEAGRLLLAGVTILGRYGPDGEVTSVGVWSRTGEIHLRAPAILRSEAAALVSIEGRPWGVMIAAYGHDELVPAGTRARLAGFTELVATVIAHAEAHAELTASRARIVATADETRRRFERDLHDGAQQRLVSLALQLRAAQAAAPAELSELKAELGRVAAGLADTLDELREYARGIHPTILADGGLAPALKALARRSPVPVALNVRAGARLPERAEVTAYYVVSEALANAAKHAQASSVGVAVDVADGVLRLSVSDDGVGGADPGRGSGLIGLKDRVAAAGGILIVHSRPGQGTRLVAELPADAGRPPGTEVAPGRSELADAR
jgi:signal transduction histidine kinase